MGWVGKGSSCGMHSRLATVQKLEEDKAKLGGGVHRAGHGHRQAVNKQNRGAHEQLYAVLHILQQCSVLLK